MKEYIRQIKKAAAVLVSICLVLTGAVPTYAAEGTASDMRLARTEGTVAVTNRNGKEMAIKTDMKLFHGYHIATQDISYAWINLDSTKMAKLDCASEAEIRQKNKDLEILLNSGNLFFNVTKKLEADESLKIRTSTMVTGIRGTCGWVKIVDPWHTKLFVLEGTVECSVTDPVTGQIKSATLHPGEIADLFVYGSSAQSDKCDIVIGGFKEEDVDGFVSIELYGNRELCDRVGQASGFNLDKLLSAANDRLRRDQDDLRARLKAVLTESSRQRNISGVNPSFDFQQDDNDSDTGENGGSSSGRPTQPTTKAESTSAAETSKESSSEVSSSQESSSEESSSQESSPQESSSQESSSEKPAESSSEKPTETTTETTTETVPETGPIELMMPVTAKEVNEYLQTRSQVTLVAGTGNNTFTVDSALDVPAGKALIINTGVTTEVAAGQNLAVNGAMTVEGDLTNSGTITIVGTMTIEGGLTNNGTIIIEGTLIVNGVLTNNGTIDNRSMNTLNVKTILYNQGVINNTGRIVAASIVCSGISSSLINKGQVEGPLSVDNGKVIDEGIINSPTLSSTGGTINLSGTDTNIQMLKLIDSEASITKGTFGAIDISGGHLVLDDGLIENGIAVQRSGDAWTTPILEINGGVVKAGDAEGAILVSCTDKSKDNEKTDVNICGGTIEGNNGKIAIMIEHGIADIRNYNGALQNNVRITSQSIDRLITVNQVDSENNFARWYSLKNGKEQCCCVDNSSLMVCNITETEIQLTKILTGFENFGSEMEEGDILILRNNLKNTLQNSSPIKISGGQESNPITLDLNGYNIDGYGLNINKGAWMEIKDSSTENNGTIILPENTKIETSGNLILRGGEYRNTNASYVLRVTDSGLVTVTDGAVLVNRVAPIDPSATYETYAGTVIENNGGTVNLGESEKQEVQIKSEVDNPFDSVFISNGGTITVENARIQTQDTSSSAALSMSIDTKLTLNDGAVLSSHGTKGTLQVISKDINSRPIFDLKGGSIVNELDKDKTPAPAIWWNITSGDVIDASNIRQFLPLNMGTTIKSRYINPVLFSGSFDNDVINYANVYPVNNDGYECKKEEDDYYHIKKKTETATSSNAVRTSSSNAVRASASSVVLATDSNAQNVSVATDSNANRESSTSGTESPTSRSLPALLKSFFKSEDSDKEQDS